MPNLAGRFASILLSGKGGGEGDRLYMSTADGLKGFFQCQLSTASFLKDKGGHFQGKSGGPMPSGQLTSAFGGPLPIQDEAFLGKPGLEKSGVGLCNGEGPGRESEIQWPQGW